MSYVDYVKYCAYQESQSSIVARLKRAYLTLPESHRDIRDSYEKINKRGKKRDKFFSMMWKGITGLWTILKLRYKLSCSWVESDDEASIEWSGAHFGGDDA